MKSYRFHRGFDFFLMWRTRIPTVLLLCLSKEQRLFFFSKQVDYSAETAIFFYMEKSWKHRFVCEFATKKEGPRINK